MQIKLKIINKKNKYSKITINQSMEQKSEYEKFKAIRVPLKDGGKFFVYFRRYVPSEVNKVSSLYQLIEKLSEKEIMNKETKQTG